MFQLAIGSKKVPFPIFEATGYGKNNCLRHSGFPRDMKRFISSDIAVLSKQDDKFYGNQNITRSKTKSHCDKKDEA